MSESILDTEWYYVGHYGRLGPLTEVQMRGLITDHVIDRTTYVWGTGMADWTPAGNVSLFNSLFHAPPGGPPPFAAPPASTQVAPPMPQADPFKQMFDPPRGYTYQANMEYGMAPYNRMNPYDYPISDKSRIAGGILQFVLPGVGRMYLGHVAMGIMQLLLTFCGVGAIWAWIDGILMLCGNVKFDGYGRRLT